MGSLYDKFYEREYVLRVTHAGEPIFQSSRLDVKFSIERLRVSHICKSSISVLGLDRDKINSIAKVAREMFQKAQEMALEVELSAGYKGNCPIIYKGYIISANVDSPPDMWLHMSCVNYTDLGKEARPVTMNLRESSKMTYMDVARYVCDEIGIKSVDFSGYNPSGSDFIGTKCAINDVFTISKAIEYLQNLNFAKWVVFYDMGRLYFVDRNPTPSPKNTIPLDKSIGLLAATNVSFSGCKIVTLMQDYGPNIQFAKVTSEYNIGANDKWTILGKKFEGHFRGDKWQTTFEMYLRDQMT